eukprot:TRINITY_DN94079_c0_g1_i1.p1 TRINITY_DN94079_c0_g1~~TRINITY_DN94079_c0_g1_i1.p1  ORF type:complete len:311 (-),score=50.69 TRINITY_DN94079_c0_g1_i1:124-1056(-)
MHGCHGRGGWLPTKRAGRATVAASIAAVLGTCRFSGGVQILPHTAGKSLTSVPVTRAPPDILEWSRPTASYGRRFKLGSNLPEGLRYCRDFITSAEEAELDILLNQGPWVRHIKSRAQQFFGLVYYHTTHNVPALQPENVIAQQGRPFSDLPPWLLQRVLSTGAFPREGEVNQVAANEYLQNAGISSHVEDPTAFGPNLATLSLLSPVQLTLTPAEEELHGRDGQDHGNWVKILLEPCSLLLLQGDSRYGYRHGIRRSKRVHLADGKSLRRDDSYRRVSLTFRELLSTRRQLAADEPTQGWIGRTAQTSS